MLEQAFGVRPRIAGALLLVLAGCATDPRFQALREETARLREEVGQLRMTEADALRRLDARTAELYGAGATYCETQYGRRAATAGTHRYTTRVFPGCEVEPLVDPEPLFHRLHPSR